MQRETLIPEPNIAADEAPLFAWGHDPGRKSEQDLYKRLIFEQANTQGLPIKHLAQRLGINANQFHKVIRGSGRLHDDVRDRALQALGVDLVCAKFCVVFLRDHTALARLSVTVTTEIFKGLFSELESCRQGELQVEIRKGVLKEASVKLATILMGHQERVLANCQSLQL